MEETAFCEIEPAVDVDCPVYGTQLIDRILYTSPAHPLVIPAPTQGQTEEQALAAYLATRMAMQDSNAAKIHLVKVKKGTMPFASPVYKTDPHRGVSIPIAEDTDMKFEGKEYRNNKELYGFWKRIGGDGRQYLAWGGHGSCLIGGESGLLGSFKTLSGLVDGAEMASQINWSFDWKGHPMPDRLYLP